MKKYLYVFSVVVWSFFIVSSNSNMWLKIFGCVVLLACICYALIKDFRKKDKSNNRLAFKKKHNLIIFIVVYTASALCLILSAIANLLYPEQTWMHSLRVPGFIGFLATMMVLNLNKKSN